VVPDALDQIMQHKEREDQFAITPQDIQDLHKETTGA
jgi:hypothetical protein